MDMFPQTGNYYEAARNCGNEYIDINDIIYDSEVENLVACIRVIADVHGMKCKQAHRFINNIINVIRVTFQLIIIHGYKGSGSFPSVKDTDLILLLERYNPIRIRVYQG